MFKGKQKTDYQREYMRKRRAGLTKTQKTVGLTRSNTIKPKEHQRAPFNLDFYLNK
jgi:hypothetical protein